MTFSILARDPDTRAIGGAVATGSVCVGGWVLRGNARAGMSASQGSCPSTLWGEDILLAMGRGQSATDAVLDVTTRDTGREYRQVSALDLNGAGAAFTGMDNMPAFGNRVFEGGVAAGNMLVDETVLDAMAVGYQSAEGPFASRLLAALVSVRDYGGDHRGLFSAAILIVSPDQAPLDLRIDCDEDPLRALGKLVEYTGGGGYHVWRSQVPTLNHPERVFRVALPLDGTVR